MGKLRYIIKNIAKEIERRTTHKTSNSNKFLGKVLLTQQEGNDAVYAGITRGGAYMAARLGGMETGFLACINRKGTRADLPIRSSLDRLCSNAGFFPNDIEQGCMFAREMYSAMAKVDLSGVSNWRMEDYLLDTYGTSDNYTSLRGLEPFFVERPWTSALAGKKVLVIHPFAETIKKQYEKREKLFENANILPEFDLYTLKAVQTIAGNQDERFETWFDALEYMHREAMKIPFDVAIIGCGAYGYPLAARIKESGKVAIHLGGVTQILFGIRGSRWENRSDYKALMNEFWVKPDESERPRRLETIEDGCYW